MIYELSSSIRSREVSSTLEVAKKYGRKLGITRVTDTTWLDRIGIPVYASIRPNAKNGVLCVNAGKGLNQIEAQVGAYMEAIEFAIAENIDNPNLTNKQIYIEELISHHEGRIDYLDLCPLIRKKIDPNEPIGVTKCIDLVTRDSSYLPSELIYLTPPMKLIGQNVFGSTTNGLASGNSIDEAILHGIMEVLERDIQSFLYFNNDSLFVETNSASENIKSLINKIESANLKVVLRYKEFYKEVSYFQAFIIEPELKSSISISVGSGCHFNKDIAAIRAITEAAQSRLSHIHGGRDDIIERVEYFRKHGREKELKTVEKFSKSVLNSSNAVQYQDIAEYTKRHGNIDCYLQYLTNTLVSRGFNSIFYTQMTDPSEEIQVVKVIIPKMESFDGTLMRVGRRLGDYVKNR